MHIIQNNKVKKLSNSLIKHSKSPESTKIYFTCQIRIITIQSFLIMQYSSQENADAFQIDVSADMNDKNDVILKTSTPQQRKNTFMEEEQIFWFLNQKVENKINWEHEKLLFESQYLNEYLQGQEDIFYDFVQMKSERNIEQKAKERDLKHEDEKSQINTPDLSGIQQVTSPIKLTLQLEPEFEKKEKEFKCNCKRSKCLKLYCECFRAGRECKNCDCLDCKNNAQAQNERKKAIKKVQQKDPHIFSDSKYKGCRCIKSTCLKGYCDCFLNGHMCGKYCKCTGCQNCKRNFPRFHRNEEKAIK